MKQCVSLIEQEFDGELRFSITDSAVQEKAVVLTLGGYDGEKLVGFQIQIPLVTKKLLFKTYQFIVPEGTVLIRSIGEKSDQFIETLVRYLEPPYPANDGFTGDEVEIDYQLRNQGGYDLMQDKIFLRLFYDEEQDDDLPKAERIHLDMNFAFNLSRETASLIVTKEGYAADLVSFLMK